MFSTYIRLRDAWENDDINGEYAKCCTCGEIRHWKTLQAGHFLPGRRSNNLFDERGCHAQCYRCNCCLNGNTIEYFDFMLKQYGKRVINQLRKQDKQIHQFSNEELEKLIEDLKFKLKGLQ